MKLKKNIANNVLGLRNLIKHDIDDTVSADNKDAILAKDEIAELLKVSPQLLAEFEAAYQRDALSEIDETSPFGISAEQAINASADTDTDAAMPVINQIVDELLAQTYVYDYPNRHIVEPQSLPDNYNAVTNDDIKKLPAKLRPQLSGNLMQKDIHENNGGMLLFQYKKFLDAKTSEEKARWYHLFRTGLDLLDLDGILYKMLETNPNAMGNWLPKLADAIAKQSFFQIPKTKILRVPITLLQMTRIDFMSLTATTRRIINEYCYKAFDLDETKEYFVKTGTYSSKFDFRNAHVHGAKEVHELGEYLTFIQHQANTMAFPTNSPCIYGVSTTNEWVVREFIQDKENNPCIYKGLPLHTEYRVFVDFDTDEILGINPYWDPDTMKQRFGHASDANNPHNMHDYIIYKQHEDVLMARYDANKEHVMQALNDLLPFVTLAGQWSIDIMQNGDDFYIIDMALAENSALYQCVPEKKRRPSTENWLPDLSSHTN